MLDVERKKLGDRAILVHMDVREEKFRENLSEFKDLVRSAGADILEVITTARNKPEAKYFVGSGKAEEIHLLVQQLEAEVVLFNHALTPSQERNLEELLECRVLDRTGLILDIFAQRARSFEGKLQVELAQLRHMSTRLVRGWTHLERQKGGIGLRGPGETQLETDRRLLSVRIKQINKRLSKVAKQRQQGRRSRQKAEVPTVSLVGYTNAGKSTLFNALAGDCVYVQDQLFATLDPTLRRVQISNDVPIILADTVGFIRHLPHDLVNAFRSTLQETSEADLLLHVIDSYDENRVANVQQVDEVLVQIKADKIPCIHIMNKVDKSQTKPRVDIESDGTIKRIWLSAQSGEGLALLRETLAKYFREEMVQGSLTLQPDQSRLRALLYDIGAVQVENIDENGLTQLKLRVSRKHLNQLSSKENLTLDIKLDN